MKIKEFATKLYGNMYDMKWDDTAKKYIPKDMEFLKPSTKFFMTLINTVQIVTNFVSICYDGIISAWIPVLICGASLIFLYFKFEKFIEKLGEKINLIVVREVVSFILFLIGICTIIL